MFGKIFKKIEKDVSWSLMKAGFNTADRISKAETKHIARKEAKAVRRMDNQ